MTEEHMEAVSPVRPSRKARAGSPAAPVAWGLLGAALLGLALVGWRTAALGQEVAAAQQDLGAISAQRTKALHERDLAHRRIPKLEQENQKLANALREITAQKDAAQTELDLAKQELAAKLAAQIKNGQVVIQQRGQDLVVDVADKVLFDTGKSELNDGGQQVLRQVSATLARTGRIFQIGGHTDAVPVVTSEVRERYPTNWELSAARATTVVRFLQERCAVPGSRLVAAGYAQFRPVASNATDEGRKRNRRIEIAMIKELPSAQPASP